jgi:thiol:disulfide interchange protein DsbD
LWAFLIGLIYGWTSCTLVCLPFISLYIVGSEKGTLRGFKTTMMFNLGRLITYALLGFAAGLLGSFFLRGLDYRLFGTILFSLFIILIGLRIIWRKKGESNCSANNPLHRIRNGIPNNWGLKPFLLGLFIALVPCAGLIAVLSLSAFSLSPITGVLAAVIFGVGSSLSPLLVVGAGAGWFARKVHSKAPNLKTYVQGASGILLILIAMVLIFNEVYRLMI